MQYLKKNYEVCFVDADKHESFLQVDSLVINYFKGDTIFLGGMGVK